MRCCCTPGRLATLTKRSLALAMMIFLFSAHPPHETEDRASVWGDGDPRTNQNLLDAGPCRWWSVACRYLDVSDLDRCASCRDTCRHVAQHSGTGA